MVRSLEFPHLSDTRFPNLSTVNVYQFRNTFDYTRWNENTKIKLCNVLWNSTYTDVVKFDTDSARDSWFDSLDDSWTLELQTAARVVPEGFIKLPIPYDIMACYNYLYVDMPIATNSDSPLDYENSNGRRRWYFFVNDIKYLGPSATQVFLVPDIWTNFQNSVDITYMMLERGHAPVYASDTDTYLANPLANNRYLLAPDVNFDNAGITKSSTFVPFGNGTKYVCIATTVSPDLISTLGVVTTNSDYDPTGPITYSDINTRYGHQLQVNGFTIGNGRDYSLANTPAKVGFSDGQIANNLTVYAIAATECYGSGTFFADILSTCPQFLTTVKACFVVDAACITLGTTYTIAGHTLYKCVGKNSTLLTKALSKAEFGYPSELQRFAKLYTAPYAQLELTDNNGNKFTVNIEETTTLTVKSVVSIAFPYINERVYVEGIGGTGSTAYSWVDLKGNTANLNMPNSDWFDYCFDWEIPTFALYMNGETAFQLESFNRNVAQAIQQSLVNYHNSMRSANTAYENAVSQSNIAYINTEAAALTSRTNSYNSADTAKTNADNSADTMKTNTDNAADTAYTILDRLCTTQRNNLDTANATTVSNEEMAITGANTILGYSNTLSDDNVLYNNRLIYYTTDANVERSTAASVNSSIGSVATSALNMGVSGAMFGATNGAAMGTLALPGGGTLGGAALGAVAGGVLGAAGGAIDATVTILNTGLTTDTAQVIADAQASSNSNMNSASKSISIYIQDVKNDVKRSNYRYNTQSSVAQMNASNATSRQNGTDEKNTTKQNATNSQSTLKTNAANTRSTSRTNASNEYTTAEANADRTRDNIQSNSGYTRQVAELNAKEILENGRYSAMSAILDARNSAPVECCPYLGNPAPDYMQTRGVQIKVKTQNDSAIRQTGDIFARFGYALNQVWDVASSGLKLMQHFTYWKASEIWIDDREASNNAVNTFMRKIFLNGVTVWNSPTEIGKINVYTN